MPHRRRTFFRLTLVCAAALFLPSAALSQAPTKEKSVAASTRLDWAFAVQGFGKDAVKLPASFDSTKQHYQVFVPKDYKKDKAWPLVLFISPGDQPSGWSAWRKVCETEGVLFASPFAAGNNVAAGQRVRIVLDVLDDVRRNYHIDPEQTYLSGFSGGGRMACAIGFALPEYFGGIVPICGTNPPPGQAYLRHRVEERLAVALVTGERDFNRKENEIYMAPWLADLGIVSKLWIVPKMGHEIPAAAVIEEAHAWLKADLSRRRKVTETWPKLAVKSNEAPAAAERAKRWLDQAATDLRDEKRVWRGVALLQGVTQRFPKTEAGQKSAANLKTILNDEKLLNIVGAQGAEDEQKSLTAQAKALERFGNIPQAIQAWQILVQNYADTPVGKAAEEQIRRLKGKAEK
jgi:predicted esterase